MSNDTHFIDFEFDGIKKTNWGLIVIAVIVDSLLLVLTMQIVLPYMKSSLPLERLTSGWIQPTLIFSLLRFIMVGMGVAMTIGGLRTNDIGLNWRKLPTGALIVFGIWILMQLVGVIISLFASGGLALSSIWTPGKISYIAGELIAQFLGNAFAEEVIFRGFLLIQICLLFKGRISGRGKLLTAAVLFSQLIFALTHIPNRIASGYSPLELLVNLLVVWISGVLFALLYLRTGNLFLTMGLHALVNTPVTIVAWPSQVFAEILPLIMILVLLPVWGPLVRWIERLEKSQLQT